MAVKGDGPETEVVLFAARPVCHRVLFTAESRIRTSRTAFVVEPKFPRRVDHQETNGNRNAEGTEKNMKISIWNYCGAGYDGVGSPVVLDFSAWKFPDADPRLILFQSC